MTPIADLALAGVADLALQEFTRRRGVLREALAQGRVTPDQAEARLAPWGAIALAAGVPLDRIAIEAPQWCVLSCDLAPEPTWHAELARARDAAVGRAHDAASIRHARDLLRLSRALGVFTPCAPEPATERTAA